MKKRRAGMVLAVVAIGFAVVAAPWFLYWHGPRFTREQSDRLQKGMTQAEVEAILGCGPGDYSDGEGYYAHCPVAVSVENLRAYNDKSWCGRNGAIDVVFDEKGRMKYAEHYDSIHPPLSLWERLQGWLGFEQRTPGGRSKRLDAAA